MRTRRILTALALSVLLTACGDGTATVSGPDTVTETDAASLTDTQADVATVTDTATFTDAVADTGTEAGALRIAAEQPPTTASGGSLDFRFQAVGGLAPYGNWHLVEGELPSGTSLDSETGAWTGTPDTEGFYYFVASVTDDEDTEALELFGIRIGDPSAPGVLAERARGYQDIHEEKHLWNGLSYGLKQPDDPDGDYQMCTLGDTTFVSGQCTMAMALRYAVEPTPEALAVLEIQVRGWRDFMLATGVPGLVGRSFVHKDDPFETGFADEENLYPNGETYRGVNGYEDYFWRGDTSRDQVTGAVLGMAMAWEVLPEGELRDMAEVFLVELADHVWDNDLKLVDPDGEMTTYGDLDGEVWGLLPVPDGLNAGCLLAWFKIAHHVSGEERFATYYDELIDRGYLGFIYDHMWVYMEYATKWYNTYMAYENAYHLMRLEQDPTRRALVYEAFRDTLWLNADDNSPNRKGIKEHNPVKTGWYLGSTGEHDPVSLYHALWQVVVFQDAPLRDRHIENSSNPDIEKNPAQETESMYPLPANLKKPDMVIWHRSPFDLDGGADSGEERTGCDYMLPYWLGRYYGWIDGAW